MFSLSYSELAGDPTHQEPEGGQLRPRQGTIHGPCKVLVQPTTPVGVALPLHRASVGQIYAGLPVVGTPLPVFLNAQFDPLTSRCDFSGSSLGSD